MSQPPRKICYLSGTRADFGLMQHTLQAINNHPHLYLSILVTGMHLSEKFGLTVCEIEAAGLTVAARIPVDIEIGTGAAMARNLAKTLEGCVLALETLQPDMLMVLGDRGEMLAGAIAAIHLNIPVVHIHGGERSGTVDEPVRHAISKLAHFHAVATHDAKVRLTRMGEREDHIFVTGAPGLDGLLALATINRAALCATVNFDANKRLALFVYHPVLQEVDGVEQEVSTLLEGCMRQNLQVLALMPNSDAGNNRVRSVLINYAEHPNIHIAQHLQRAEFVSWMAVCDVMIGNSSSGIIEAATFGTPVINVGTRQNLRERNANVTDIQAPYDDIDNVILRTLHQGRFIQANVYGCGQATEKIVSLLEALHFSPSTLLKANVY